MMRAIWNETVIAEAAKTVEVEGNQYFPVESLRSEYFSESSHHTVCPWKGIASYYDITVDGAVNANAAWYYAHPSPLARKIKSHVAFWNGVKVEGVPE